MHDWLIFSSGNIDAEGAWITFCGACLTVAEEKPWLVKHNLHTDDLDIKLKESAVNKLEYVKALKLFQKTLIPQKGGEGGGRGSISTVNELLWVKLYLLCCKIFSMTYKDFLNKKDYWQL